MKEKELRSIMIKNLREGQLRGTRARAKKQKRCRSVAAMNTWRPTCFCTGATGIAAWLGMYEIREKGRTKLRKQQVDLVSHGYSKRLFCREPRETRHSVLDKARRVRLTFHDTLKFNLGQKINFKVHVWFTLWDVVN